MSETVVCLVCGKEMPFAADFCSSCCRSLRKAKARDSNQVIRLQPLEIADEVDTKLITDSVFKNATLFVEYLYPTRAELLTALRIIRTTDYQRQILIRRFGLDGLAPRTVMEIADESRASTSSVHQLLAQLKQRLRPHLLEHKG